MPRIGRGFLEIKREIECVKSIYEAILLLPLPLQSTLFSLFVKVGFGLYFSIRDNIYFEI